MKEKEFLQAISEHKGIIVKVSRMYFNLRQDQEDLFQEIVLQLWKSNGSFKGGAKFSTWMYRVAINTALVYFKKDKKRKKQHETDSGLWNNDPENAQVQAFYKGVQQLNKIEKALIIQYIDGLSGDEIAANLGISAGNVRVKLNRTKLKLQDIIKKNGYEF